MRFPRPSLVAALAIASAVFISGSVARADRASDAALAQSLFDEGRKLMDAGQLAAACPKLEESQRLDPGPGTQYHLADCYERTGRTASAWAVFLEVAAAAKARNRPDHEKRARDRAAALEPTLSKLAIVVPQASRVEGMVIKRGDEELREALWGTPAAIDPGTYQITITAPGKQSLTRTVEVTAGAKTQTFEVPALVDEVGPTSATPGSSSTPPAGPATDIHASDADDGNTMRLVSYVALGVGVVGVGAGSYFAIKSSGKRSDADDLYDACGNACPASDPRTEEIQTLDSDAASLKTNAIIGFIVGGVGLAGGATLFFLSGKDDTKTQSASIAPWIGVQSVGVTGSF